jgi:ribosome-binding factor A
MESTRQLRMASLLQQELGNIFLRLRTELAGAFVTVTKVRATPDLSIAKVYLSIFQGPAPEAVIASIQEQTKAVRGMLGQSIGKSVRVVPELQFYLDDSLDYIERIEDLLKK